MYSNAAKSDFIQSTCLGVKAAKIERASEKEREREWESPCLASSFLIRAHLPSPLDESPSYPVKPAGNRK